MKKFHHLATAACLICALVILPLASACQLQETPPPQPPTPSENKTLTLMNTTPVTLDPAISSDTTSHSYIMQIFSGLVRLDNQLNPSPDIARTWQISPDGKTYTFNLRRGVRFHNGREVTAQNFKYSWERACNPRTASQTAETYLGDIVGVKDVLQGNTTAISGVKTIDDYTLEILIDAPKAYFLAKLAYPTAFVVDQANVEQDSKWWNQPNGTGPFKLKEWKQDELLALEQNKLYYHEPAEINNVVFHLLAGVPMVLYEMGKIDVAPVYQAYIDRAIDKDGPFHQELAVFPELSLFYVGFNIQKPPFDDINIRRAFCHAVNKQRIIEITLKGTMNNANGIIPIGMPGYNENVRGSEYDIEQARSLIASSTYGEPSNLPPITITVSGWGGNIPEYLGAIIQEWQQNLGVKITVRQLEPEVFLYSIREEADEMFMLGWVADYPDPQNFLDNLFHTGAEYNTGKYSNPELDKILDSAAVEPDNKSRLAMYQQAEQMILDDAPCLPLWFGINYVLVKPDVKNYKLNALGIPLLSQVYIED